MPSKKLPHQEATPLAKITSLGSEPQLVGPAQHLKPLSTDLPKDETGIRLYLRQMVEDVNNSSEPNASLSRCIALLNQAYLNARLSWLQIASIFRSDLKYTDLYQYLFNDSKEEIEAAVGSPGENFVQLLAFMAAVREKKLPIKSPPQYFKNDGEVPTAKEKGDYFVRSNRVKGRSTIHKSSIADSYEANLRNDSEFTQNVLDLTSDQPITYWVYEAVRDWFVPCDNDFNPLRTRNFNDLDDLTRLILPELCFERSIGILAVHPFGSVATSVEVQVQRVRIQRQRTCGPRMVVIPGFYQPSQIRTHATRDFIDLYGCMAGVPRTSPRKSVATLKRLARKRFEDLKASGELPTVAWAQVGREMGWTEETLQKRIGAEPALLHRRELS